MSTRTYVNSLSVDEASCIVAWLPLESLAHTTMRINKTFRDATRNHIKRNVLPILAPLRRNLWFVNKAVMSSSSRERLDFQYYDALTQYKWLQFCNGFLFDLSKAIALGAFANVETLWLDGAILDESAADFAKACAEQGALSSLRYLWINGFASDAGVDAFAKCITNGGMPSLKSMVLIRNPNAPTLSMVPLRAACTSRGVALL